VSVPRIGKDEWVASVDVRRETAGGPLGAAFRRLGRGWGLALFGVLAALYPVVAGSDFLVRIGVNVLLLVMLVLGLNVVVGWTGLLDLGYVAYYGLGAYGYAFLSSNQFGVHLPTLLAVAIVVVGVALVGYLLGLPTRRLSGDYLAILTLFFLQVFVELSLNLDRLRLPFVGHPVAITGGPNGIAGVDPMHLLGIALRSVTDYYYLLLVLVVGLLFGLGNLERSRSGRAWMAIREDPLAAEHMTVPVARMKVLAYALGATVAALAGTVFAAVQVGVFPQNFTVTLIIVVYAGLILGGAGSLPGAVVGAIIIGAVPEILRIPGGGRVLFYGGLLLAVIFWLRPRRRGAAVVGGTLLLGFVVRAVVMLLRPGAIAPVPDDAGGFSRTVGHWVVLVVRGDDWVVDVGFVALVALVLLVVVLKEPWRTAALVPVAYLAVFVWENRLVNEVSITRQMVFGALLVVMMAVRPQGLLGKPRVEVV